MNRAKRVLIVEDDAHIANLLRMHLRDEGYGFLRVHGYLASKEDAYIPVKLTDGTNFWNALLATADGIKFKWLPPFWRGAEALPSISVKAGGGGLIFNAASTGVTATHRFETNPDAQEVYLAV